ncbi:hypothetical protein AALO_G00173200 [Alosa alosa]|uniref:Pre-B-cell leukemia transcription factor-interacting protein 1 n=1 Tax=Alosa alosa TaxID=278164 RepID=A0AAV6GDJ2_9TELE|nr:hypothetical protein AALO_G00173200 [Alosa alosa]
MFQSRIKRWVTSEAQMDQQQPSVNCTESHVLQRTEQNRERTLTRPSAEPHRIATVDRLFDMHPQRPLPQAMPSSLGQHLRDAALGLGRRKEPAGREHCLRLHPVAQGVPLLPALLLPQDISFLGQGHQSAMSDNSNSANGNNWTIIPPEAPVAENVGPVLEDSRCHGDMSSSVDPDPPPGVQIESAHPPLQQMGPEPSSEAQAQPLLSSRAEALHGQSGTNQPVEQEPVSEGLSLDGLDDHTQNDDSTPSVVPLSSVAEGDESTGLDEHSVHDGYAEGHTHSSTETDLFSDSYTHISSAPDAIHTVEKEEELQEKEEGLDQGRKGTDEVILSAREEEAGLSLNKCILGALLLLGLGTIFFSGVFMDLDEEADDVKELKDRDLAQEWLKSKGRPDAYAGVKHPGLVDKENEQIAVLQAQLQQAQKEQLTSAQQLLQEGVKEQERREHLEEENLKMKGELESLPARQKELEQENERMRKEQERSRRELDALKAKMGAVPSAGQPTEQQSSQDPQQKGGGGDAKDKKKPLKLEKEKVEKEQKKEWKKEEKEGKKGKEQGRAAKHHKDDKKDNRGQITDDKTSSHLHDDDDDEHDDDGDASHLRGDYWNQQRQKLHHSRGPPAECSDAAACARAQGLVPVSLADFEALLLAYLDRLDVGAASSSEDQASRRQKLGALVREFFAADGLFVHDRTPFGEFVEDVSDILEDMAEEGENQEMEEEMEGFEKEALERFAMQEEGGKGGADRGEESKRRSSRVKG